MNTEMRVTATDIVIAIITIAAADTATTNVIAKRCMYAADLSDPRDLQVRQVPQVLQARAVL